MFPVSSPCRFALATLQGLGGHAWPVAALLGTTAADSAQLSSLVLPGFSFRAGRTAAWEAGGAWAAVLPLAETYVLDTEEASRTPTPWAHLLCPQPASAVSLPLRRCNVKRGGGSNRGRRLTLPLHAPCDFTLNPAPRGFCGNRANRLATAHLSAF